MPGKKLTYKQVEERYFHRLMSKVGILPKNEQDFINWAISQRETIAAYKSMQPKPESKPNPGTELWLISVHPEKVFLPLSL